MRRLVSGLAVATTVAAMLVVAVSAPAHAEDNGVGQKPALGWSSWSFIRHNPTAANIEATADAMKGSGLAAVGYQYVNVDDFWYQCPGSQGPNVDQYGRWVTDTTKFPPSGAENGIQVVADYVHSKGLSFGLYVTPGISHQAVVQNTAIEGTPYHADDIATTAAEKNYNCKGMVGLDYSKPGAQEFVDSWAKQFAGWGVDYVKIDGVGTPDIPDIQAWSDALKNTGRPMHLELSNSLDINNAPTWARLSNGWRTGGDVECYCGPGGSSYPLTDWSHVSSRFNQVANWAPYGGPGGFNDYDSIEVGNGANDGLTMDERKTQLSLWALASSPFILGTDITNLDPIDLGLLKNTDVLAVDQDAIDATRIANTSGQQVFTKKEPNGDAIVGLFNTNGAAQPVSTTAAALGLTADSTAYNLDDLWTHQNTETAGVISANVPAHGVAFYRVTPVDNPTQAPPQVVLTMNGLDNVTPGQPSTVTESFTDNGVLPAQNVQLSLDAPADWNAHATTPTRFGSVQSGQTVQASWQVSVQPPSAPFGTSTVTGSARYGWPRGGPLTASTSKQVTLPTTVAAPYHTFSSTSPAATFGQAANTLGIRAAGSDVFGATNQYGATYLRAAEQDGTTDTVQLTAQANTSDWAKAGIMVRNDIAQSGTSPGFVILAASPGHGYVLQWDANGDGQLDSNSAPSGQGTGTTVYPSWLKLTRSGTTFTGSYSTDGTTWTQLGSADVPSAAASQDAGVFSTAHASTVGESDFADLSVGPPSGLIDAPSTAVTLPGQPATVHASFYDHGSAAVSNVAITMSAPDGWTVSPAGPIPLGTVATSADASWQVTAPADAPVGPAPLHLVATYDDGGRNAQSQTDVTAVVPSTDLSAAYDNVGITDDTNTSVGNIDGAGSSLSAQALAAVGVTPGSAVTHNGMQFAWPNVAAGQNDNVVASGQSFQVSGTGANLGFLATATYGPATGTGTITYTDGTTQQFTLTVPDWYSNPPSGSDPVITMTYRNRDGNTQQAHAINVFLVKVPVQAGKTPSGVILPNVSGPPASGTPSVHVFGIAVGN